MMSSDLAFALRRWRKKPIPAIAALVTLALGTGANTAIFSIIHSVMLKPLPYVEPQRLVQIWSVDLDPNSNLCAMATRDKQLASKLAPPTPRAGEFSTPRRDTHPHLPTTL